MITPQSYWTEEVKDWEDLIEAFSPFDRGTPAYLSIEQRIEAVKICLLRTACLLSYHGPEVPRRAPRL
jgi:hypothetical protein